ncbi:MAG: DUF3810 domain-containing protein [Atopobiaceae bacterium]|nr:DUF3810 domain-containing protein [Atopobiaceae bacterium]
MVREVQIDGATCLRLGVSAALAAVCLALRAVFAWRGAELFPAWRAFSKGIVGVLATACGVAPFAVWDVAALVLLMGALITLVRRVRAHDSLLPWASWVALVGTATMTLFVCWALNHYAPPLAGDLGLEVGQYSTDELADATAHYLEEAARLAPQVPRDDGGALVRQDFYELAGIAGASYEGLAGEYPVFVGPTVPVKALLVWGEPQLYSGHTGIFWAPTGESTVPLNCAIADMPFTMCHEVAHRMGIASEREANFAAFLACVASDDVRFAYAGNYSAFCYCVNALLRVDPERAQQMVQEVADAGLAEGVTLVLGDRVATHKHYDAYEGPFEDVGTTVNNTYLRSFGEDVGVRSYGLVVDYLIAWYEQAA